MSYLQVFKIGAGETRTLSVDFSNRLPSGLLLESGTVSAINEYTGLADAGLLGSSTATISADFLSASVAIDGVSAISRHLVTFELTCDDATPTVLRETILVMGTEYGL